uniref:EF-hand domain-containing protein n=1 Tax=Chromera velia CCMP2878 TaxID=1169474 RepID=A0A0G4GW07_9ALVE|eukprot:Cvel_23626.t1-p1 / transcript=Cvel_23626.t1 / gene=Cvel_23626 / organism=Chromera_velia_CCMP2878 / gene_product=Sodium channel protein type 10 subunit alpha, putative / transcript_product=Sodium channel protein type 10 subunit alpha, putative / location=Cvel_scaffold2455:14355-20948(+) / protein_length=633 / sequence_SO=supercontig / SO=protein_coding / is_pseudo=false
MFYAPKNRGAAGGKDMKSHPARSNSGGAMIGVFSGPLKDKDKEEGGHDEEGHEDSNLNRVKSRINGPESPVFESEKERRRRMLLEKIAERGWLSQKLGSVFSSTIYEWTMAAVILVNAVIIGLATDRGEPYRMLDNVLLKWYCYRWQYYTDSWNIFDFILVLASWADWAVTLSSDGEDVSALTALRCARIVRIVRIFRLTRVSRDLELLLKGIMAAFKDDPLIDEYFGSVPKSMLTLFQIMTLESWTNGIVRPAEKASPGKVMLFIVYVFLSTFGLLNVLTAIFVENTIAQSKEDDEEKQRLAIKEKQVTVKLLTDLIQEADVDGSGTLTREELEDMMDKPEFFSKLLKLDLEQDEAIALHEILDVDGTGEVPADDWIKACMDARGMAKALDVMRAQSEQTKVSKELERQLFRTEKRVEELRNAFQVTHEGLSIVAKHFNLSIPPLPEAPELPIPRASMASIMIVQDPSQNRSKILAAERENKKRSSANSKSNSPAGTPKKGLSESRVDTLAGAGRGPQRLSKENQLELPAPNLTEDAPREGHEAAPQLESSPRVSASPGASPMIRASSSFLNDILEGPLDGIVQEMELAAAQGEQPLADTLDKRANDITGAMPPDDRQMLKPHRGDYDSDSG